MSIRNKTISPKRGGVSANPKNPYQKKLRWSKKGGGLSFLTKSKKNSFFFNGSPKWLNSCKLVNSVVIDCDVNHHDGAVDAENSEK